MKDHQPEEKMPPPFWGDLFPTKGTAFVFVLYMFLSVNQAILVTLTKTTDNTYAFNTTSVVFLTECFKLVIAALLYTKEKPLKKLFPEIKANWRVGLMYLIPASLYCLYNNLSFVSLATYDPTTYYVLLQFRVVVTGLVFQILFKRQLSAWQWISLCLLTTGCIVKHVGHYNHPAIPSTSIGGPKVGVESFLNFNLFLVLIQVLCSCSAGVYNEYLLKGNSGTQVHIMVQNIYMYLDSIVCNLLVLFLTNTSQLSSALSVEAMLQLLLDPRILALMVNNAIFGITTSVFLKNLNSILKTFASAIELVFTAVVCWILFSIAIDLYTVIAIAIVSFSIFMYSKNPIVNRPVENNDVEYKLLQAMAEDVEFTRSKHVPTKEYPNEEV